MYRTSIDFHNRLISGEVPIAYILITTHMGYRAYAEKELSGVFGVSPTLWDGTYDFDGTITYGSESAGIIEKAGRVINFGAFDRNLQSMKEDILGSYASKTLQHLTVELDNSDRYFSQLIASEPFISRPIMCYLGFEALAQSSHLKLFSGIITEMNIMPTMTIEADEE